MKTYELTYIVSPEITSEEAEAKAKEVESAIKNREGVILKQSNPIAKTLSYPIKKRASGFFGVLEFQLEPEKLIEIKEILEKDGKIVRHMVIIKLPQKPRKERRSKPAPAFEIEKKVEMEPVITKEEKQVKVQKEKVELKDIEQKLDELLGE
jgi:ribosomal protein S6